MRIAEAFLFGNITQLRPSNDRQIFLAIGRQKKKPRYAPGLCGERNNPRYYCDMFPDLSGTQVVCCLSYLNPGADFSASLVVFIVR